MLLRGIKELMPKQAETMVWHTASPQLIGTIIFITSQG